MALEPVPWAVHGGALTSAEVGRELAYLASGQIEGVAGSGDFKVTASAIPDGNVHIAPGAISALNRFAGGGSQSYIIRNISDTVQALDPQPAGSSRVDLVCVIVQDPQYAGQPAPASVPNGPYVKIQIYKDIGAARSIAEVDAAQTGYALARVSFAASDSTVTAGEIEDVREMIQPRQITYKFPLNGVAAANFAGALAVAPTGASFPVKVPTWAKRAILEARWAGLVFTDGGAGNGSANGTADVRLGALGSSATTWKADATAANKPVTQAVIAAEDIDCSALAGTTVNLQARLAKTGGAGMTAAWSTQTVVVLEVTFKDVLI